MNRVELKRKAKMLAFQNKWTLWEPVMLFAILAVGLSILEAIFEMTGLEVLTLLTTLVYILVFLVFSVAYLNYVVSFTKGKKKNFIELMKGFKDEILTIILIMIIVMLIVMFWSIFFIIPGIIASYIYYMVLYVKAMNIEYSTGESIKEGKSLIKGFKMDFFIFQLSFIPWIFLCMITLGIALIWFIPYYTVAEAMYYNKLVELKASE